MTLYFSYKFVYEFSIGNFENGIMLVPGRIGAKWFQRLSKNSSCWCALDGRLTFIGATNSAPFPSALILYTINPEFVSAFIDEYCEMGLLWKLV